MDRAFQRGTCSRFHSRLTQGVTAGFKGGSAGTGMAGKTFFLLRKFIHCRILRSMYFMAACAGHIFFLVCAAWPIYVGAFVMACEANFILLNRWCLAVKGHTWKQA
jgi:hypothetical protein